MRHLHFKPPIFQLPQQPEQPPSRRRIQVLHLRQQQLLVRKIIPLVQPLLQLLQQLLLLGISRQIQLLTIPHLLPLLKYSRPLLRLLLLPQRPDRIPHHLSLLAFQPLFRLLFTLKRKR